MKLPSQLLVKFLHFALTALGGLVVFGCAPHDQTANQETKEFIEKAANKAEEQDKNTRQALKPNFTRQSKAKTTAEMEK